MIKLFGDLLKGLKNIAEKDQEYIANTTIYAMFLSFSLALFAFLLAV